MRRIRFTAVMYERILEEGQDENEAIVEMIEKSLPSGAELLDWEFLDGEQEAS